MYCIREIWNNTYPPCHGLITAGIIFLFCHFHVLFCHEVIFSHETYGISTITMVDQVEITTIFLELLGSQLEIYHFFVLSCIRKMEQYAKF
jgi:hypothetical protein